MMNSSKGKVKGMFNVLVILLLQVDLPRTMSWIEVMTSLSVNMAANVSGLLSIEFSPNYFTLHFITLIIVENNNLVLELLYCEWEVLCSYSISFTF